MELSYNRYSKRTYKIKKEKPADGGQYYVVFDDDGSFFYLQNATTLKEAKEEANEYDAEGLFRDPNLKKI